MIMPIVQQAQDNKKPELLRRPGVTLGVTEIVGPDRSQRCSKSQHVIRLFFLLLGTFLVWELCVEFDQLQHKTCKREN